MYNRSILIVLFYTCAISVHLTIAQNEGKEQPRSSDECQVTPVIHVLQYPGCVPKPIPSFACIGRCSSYLQVKICAKMPKTHRIYISNSKSLHKSTSKFWWKLMEIYANFDENWCKFSTYRFRAVKFGRWNVHACAVRNLVNEKQLFHYFAQKLNQANENSEK